MGFKSIKPNEVDDYRRIKLRVGFLLSLGIFFFTFLLRRFVLFPPLFVETSIAVDIAAASLPMLLVFFLGNFNLLPDYGWRNIVGYSVIVKNTGEYYVASNSWLRGVRYSYEQNPHGQVLLRLNSRRGYKLYGENLRIQPVRQDPGSLPLRVRLTYGKSTITLKVEDFFEFYTSHLSIDDRIGQLFNEVRQRREVERASRTAELDRRSVCAAALLNTLELTEGEENRLISPEERMELRGCVCTHLLQVLPPDHPKFEVVKSEFGRWTKK
ncbi:MAG: hypothetical protein AAB467_00040 [Patescibacteria group bacterium]